MLQAKKRELSEKTGKEDVITSVQVDSGLVTCENVFKLKFKNYVNKLRNKTNMYKRKKAEMDDIKTESGVLGRTVEILNDRWEELQQDLVRTMQLAATFTLHRT